MDLRPGRQNLELDDDSTGTYVVTRIVVETPEGGDDDLVIERSRTRSLPSRRSTGPESR
jgi:hypothetical protein